MKKVTYICDACEKDAGTSPLYILVGVSGIGDTRDKYHLCDKCATKLTAAMEKLGIASPSVPYGD